MDNEPTRTIHHEEHTDGYTETTHEHLCSVELGATAHGKAQVKSVKVYAATSGEAARQAMATFLNLQSELQHWGGGDDAAQ